MKACSHEILLNVGFQISRQVQETGLCSIGSPTHHHHIQGIVSALPGRKRHLQWGTYSMCLEYVYGTASGIPHSCQELPL